MSVSLDSGHMEAEVSAEGIRAQLDTILASSAFKNSNRHRRFLQYVVEKAILGETEDIKERSIGIEVFDRRPDYDLANDAIVRVGAGEIRKRLAQYYLHDARADEIVVELPRGSYVPVFSAPLPSIPAAVPGAVQRVGGSGTGKPLSRRRFAWILGGLIGALGAASSWQVLSDRRTPLDRLWQPVFTTKAPLVIFIPIVTERSNAALSDRVGIGPTMALRRAADFLDKHQYPYRLRFGSDLTFAQLREQPSLLLGGFTSIWTQLMTRNLRFSLMGTEHSSEQAIIDTQSKRMWKPVNLTPEGYADQDYGLLCRLFDKASGQIAMIAAGITTFGTAGAAAVLFDTDALDDLVRQAPKGWETMNFEAVIHVSIIGATPSLPQLVASHFW